MYNGINEMIDDLMEHITENNVLFPRPRRKEKAPAGSLDIVRSYLATLGGLYDGPLQATLKFSFISPAVFAGKQPARAQQHKPQWVDHRASRYRLPGQQHQHKDEEGHVQSALRLT